MDSEGIHTIALGTGLSADKLTAYRTNWNDLTLTFKDTDDKIVISGYFTSEGSRKFNLHFANGTKFAYDDEDNPMKQVHATEYDDWMSAWSDEGIVLYGDKGNDHLTGGKGNDILSGGKGDDYLSGKNDTLIIKDFDADLFVFEFANGKKGVIDDVTDEFTEMTEQE